MTDSLEKDLELMSDVLEVRSAAMSLAFLSNHGDLYVAANSEDDTEILRIVTALAEATKIDNKEVAQKLESAGSLYDHFETMVDVARTQQLHQAYLALADKARAVVDLGTSGEVCYPPTLKSTEELMRKVALLQAELATVEG